MHKGSSCPAYDLKQRGPPPSVESFKDAFYNAFSQDIEHLKRVEKEAYPPHLRELGEITTWGEFCNYCESEKAIITQWETGYMIHTRYEIIDLASTKPLRLITLIELKNVLKSTYGALTFSFSARVKTTWKLIARMVKTGELELLSRDREEREDEVFYKCFARFIN